jgi:hypothetical protein
MHQLDAGRAIWQLTEPGVKSRAEWQGVGPRSVLVHSALYLSVPAADLKVCINLFCVCIGVICVHVLEILVTAATPLQFQQL